MLPLSHLTEENPEGQSGPQSHSKGAMGPGFQPSSGPLEALLYIRPLSSPWRCPSHPGCLPSLLWPSSPAHARGPFRNGGILLGSAFGPALAPTAALTSPPSPPSRQCFGFSCCFISRSASPMPAQEVAVRHANWVSWRIAALLH